MNFPDELRYSSDHEWVRLQGEEAVIGITDVAQSELGDIVFVDVDKEGENLKAGEVFGSIEAVKTVSDLMMPIAAEVLELNPALEENPELVNKEPYGQGWIIRVKPANPKDSEGLMSAEDYKKHIAK